MKNSVLLITCLSILISCDYKEGELGATVGNCDEICTIYYTVKRKLRTDGQLNIVNFPGDTLERSHVKPIKNGHRIESWFVSTNEQNKLLKNYFSCRVIYNPEKIRYEVIKLKIDSSKTSSAKVDFNPKTQSVEELSFNNDNNCREYEFKGGPVKYCRLNDSIEFIERTIWTENDLSHQQESFKLLNGQIIYAYEKILYYDDDRTIGSTWSCTYHIQDGEVIDYSSNGHGETESDEWEPESIFEQWRANLKRSYDRINKNFVIDFGDFELSFKSMDIGSHDSIFGKVHEDTAIVVLGLRENMDLKPIKLLVKSNMSSIHIYEQFKTSMSISDEGAHLDLLKWKHFTSEKNQLSLEYSTFRTDSISMKESKSFPIVTQNEIILKVLEQTGSTNNKFYKRALECENPNSYPCYVSVSQKILTIKYLDETGNKKHKIVIFNIPLGC